MAKKYAVNGTVVGRVVYAGVSEKTYDSGASATIYSMMFVSPEGVTFSSEKKVWTAGKDGVAKPAPVKFIADWIDKFYTVKDIVDRNKGLSKEVKENVYVKASMYPAKDGRMFGTLSATLNDKGKRLIRLNDVMPQMVTSTVDAEGNTVLKFDREEYIYKIVTGTNGRQTLASEKKSACKFEDVLTRFKVAMIATEVNGDEVVFAEDDGQYAATIETVSLFDNSRIEIGQGYEFEITFEKGQLVQVDSDGEDDFGWDSDSGSSNSVELPATVKVFLVRGKVAGYTMEVDNDYTSGDNYGGF